MKILLQNLQSKHYFSLLGFWTPNPKLAHDFRHSESAFDFVSKNEIQDVQLVVRFDEPGWDEIVPMPLHIATLSTRAVA